MRAAQLVLLAAAPMLGLVGATSPLATGPWGARKATASEDAIIESGQARFTVLTPELLRFEWKAEDGEFEDRATVAFINRFLDVPEFTASNSDGVLRIETSALALSYQVGAAFSEDSLVVTSLDNSSAFDEWHFGKHDSSNLLGTIRTLDGEDVPPLNCTMIDKLRKNMCGWDHSDCQCEWGVVGREGWAVVDDSDNWCLRESDDWWDSPNQNEVDLYLFAFGHDYKAALQAFVQVGGAIAMPQRRALGTWWTRWYDMAQDDVVAIVEDFRKDSLPLDVMVLDMNWHTKNDWTGYSFDSRLYPYPEDLLDALAAQGLLTAANLHDADGVNSWEDQFEAACAQLGLDPSSLDSIPFNVSDQASQLVLEDVVLKAVEDLGMDFWWIDWQQGESGYGAAGGKQNPTIWTAHMRSTDRQRRGDDTRATVLARWGGLGGHRYQVGFSGDVLNINWKTLAYQPYFTATAANVAFSSWSHDIVGPGDDMELYTRWVQWGAHSGVLRLHDRGGSAGACADTATGCWVDMPWLAPSANFDAMRNAMRGRAALLPYLYTHTRLAFETGVSLVRPSYYEFPEEQAAYGQGLGLPQYFLGDDLVVAPVVTKANATTQLATQRVWVPPQGPWIDTTTGVVRTATPSKGAISASCPVSSNVSSSIDCAPPFDEVGCLAKGCCWDPQPEVGAPQCFLSDAQAAGVVVRPTDLDEVPVLARSGSIIPKVPLSPALTQDLIGVAGRALNALQLDVFVSGAASGSASVYEDDGETVAYVQDGNGGSAWTQASWHYLDGDAKTQLQLDVVTTGAFQGLPDTRDLEVHFVNAPPAASVRLIRRDPHQPNVPQGAQEVLPALTRRHRSRQRATKGTARQDTTAEEDSVTAETWHYDGASATLVVSVTGTVVNTTTSLVVTLACPDAGCGDPVDQLLSGAKGTLRRTKAAKETLDQARLCPGESDTTTGFIQRLSSTGAALSHLAVADVGAFWATVADLDAALVNATAELAEVTINDPASAWRVERAAALFAAAQADRGLL